MGRAKVATIVVGQASAPAQVGHQTGATGSCGQDAVSGCDDLERPRDGGAAGPDRSGHDGLGGLRGRSERGQADAGNLNDAEDQGLPVVSPVARHGINSMGAAAARGSCCRRGRSVLRCNTPVPVQRATLDGRLAPDPVPVRLLSGRPDCKRNHLQFGVDFAPGAG